MQTDEDKQIQKNLEKPGKGLPTIDALFLRYIGFPILKLLMSWDRGMKLFEHEGNKILIAVKSLDEESLFKKVLVPRTFGIEDSSRYYSPAMVLWHLIYVGNAIQEGIISLSNNESLDFVVKIENFKPFVEIDKNIVNEFKLFLDSYRIRIESNVKNKYIRNFHAHPWFGPLNPHQWLIMSAVHQAVHGRQLRRILESA
jgi:hypothetical protein